MFSFLKKTVTVSFVDHNTGTTFASSEVPLDQLPETFAINTELDIKQDHYVVVSAEPQTKQDFAKSKKLSIRLLKVETVDPKSILFSLPSICNSALPECVRVENPDGIPVLHEDDWRQCEFVTVNHETDISAELSDIRSIHVNSTTTSGGWKAIHVRKRIANPLPEKITWHMVTACIACPITPIPSIAFSASGWSGAGPTAKTVDRVRNAVVAQFDDGVLIWGNDTAGELSTLCVENIEKASPKTIQALQQLSDTLSLVFVHWCRCQAYAPRGAKVINAEGNPWDCVG